MPSKKIDAESVLGKPFRVKYKDVFDFKEFYGALHEWLLHYSWIDIEEGEDRWENLYYERIDRNGNKEIWIQWRPFKKADSGPFNYYLDFNFHALGLSTTEVVKDGIKMKVNKGELELFVDAKIEKSYVKDFEKNAFLKEILDLFNRRVYRQEYEERKKELYQEVYILQNFIKQWFKLKRYLPYEETKGFFTSYAWPSHLKE